MNKSPTVDNRVLTRRVAGMTLPTSVAGAAGDSGTILKLEVRLLPFVSVLYVVAFDRASGDHV